MPAIADSISGRNLGTFRYSEGKYSDKLKLDLNTFPEGKCHDNDSDCSGNNHRGAISGPNLEFSPSVPSVWGKRRRFERIFQCLEFRCARSEQCRIVSRQ